MASGDSRPSINSRTPDQQDPEIVHQVHLLTRLLFAMALLTVVGALAALFDPHNDLAVTALFYLTVWLWFGLVYTLARRGHVTAATWFFATSFWLLIAGVTLFF